MINIIAAISSNNVIGDGEKLLFNYKSDMKHFKQCTSYSNVIMGRKTFESIGKPLPNRNNIVVSSKMNDTGDNGIYVKKTLTGAMNLCKIFSNSPDTWIIGGASIYEEGMNYCDNIYLTITPDIIKNEKAVYFPFINPLKFKISSIEELDKENNLMLVKYVRSNLV